MSAPRTIAAAAALGMVALCAPYAALAEGGAETAGAAAASSEVPEALMTGLAAHAARVEEMKQRGAFTMAGRLEALNGDGNPTERKEVVLRSTPTRLPMDRIIKVIRYVEDGKDKTFDAQVRATERRVKRLGDPDKQAEERKKDLKLPFLASERSRYVFGIVERDAAHPRRVRIAFTPKVPAENAIKGSAWVDEQEREVLSLGFSFSKNPTFVDHVEVKVTFGLPTELGRAPSQLAFDGRGGFLFIRKHYRGTATLYEPSVVF
jgi:hypothetical protein